MADRAQIRRWLGPASPQYDMSGKEWRVDFIMSVERTFKGMRSRIDNSDYHKHVLADI
jgi:hypothetical protein